MMFFFFFFFKVLLELLYTANLTKPIGYLIYPICDILPNKQLRIIFYGSVVMTKKFPITNRVYISNWGFVFPY